MFNQYGVNEAEGAAMNINFRQIILVLSGQLRAALMSKRVLIGYLIGVMAALKAAYLYGEYASNHPIQIFEPWLMNFRSLADITIMLVGFILVVADAPFVDSRSLDGKLYLYDSSWLYSKSMECGNEAISFVAFGQSNHNMASCCTG